MKTENLIWLAGIFEGEGTTGLYKYRRRENGKEQGWRISSYWLVCNNDPVIINEVMKIALENEVKLSIYTRYGDSKTQGTNYQVLTKNMSNNYKLLKLLYPYLRGNKKAIAEMTMRFIESREFGKIRRPYSDEEENLYTESKQMNQTGPDKKYSESSEAIRLTLEQGEDMVQTSLKIGEGLKP